MHFFVPTKIHFLQTQTIFSRLFLTEDGKIETIRFSKLHYRFRRYKSLIKTVWPESHGLQSYVGLLDIFRPKFEEDLHNSAGKEIQAKKSQSSLYFVEIDNAAY